jgi:hypothetical protein
MALKRVGQPRDALAVGVVLEVALDRMGRNALRRIALKPVADIILTRKHQRIVAGYHRVRRNEALLADRAADQLERQVKYRS